MKITVSQGEFKGFVVWLLPPFPSLVVQARILEQPSFTPTDERRGKPRFKPGDIIDLLKHEYSLLSSERPREIIVLNRNNEIYHKQWPPAIFSSAREANEASPLPHHLKDYAKFKSTKRGRIQLRALQIRFNRAKV